MRALAAFVVVGTGVAHAGPPSGGAGNAVSGLTVSGTLDKHELAPGDPIVVHVVLANTGKHPQDVVSHIATHETHYDPFVFQIYWPRPSKEGCSAKWVGTGTRTVELWGSRDKSGPVTVTLADKPIRHDIDLADWAGRVSAGPLGPGTYLLRVDYTHKKGTKKLVTRSKLVGFTITGTPKSKDMCATNPGWSTFGPR